MDESERRIASALLLLMGLTSLTLGLYTGQLSFVLELVKRVFKTAIAPLSP